MFSYMFGCMVNHNKVHRKRENMGVNVWYEITLQSTWKFKQFHSPRYKAKHYLHFFSSLFTFNISLIWNLNIDLNVHFLCIYIYIYIPRSLLLIDRKILHKPHIIIPMILLEILANILHTNLFTWLLLFYQVPHMEPDSSVAVMDKLKGSCLVGPTPTTMFSSL